MNIHFRILLLFGFLLDIETAGQNLILNNSFELGAQNYPNDRNQLNSKSQSWGVFLTPDLTPDWYTTLSFPNSFKGYCNNEGLNWHSTGTIITSCPDGNFYAGIGDCEAIVSELSKPVQKYSLVKFSFYYMPRGTQNSGIEWGSGI